MRHFFEFILRSAAGVSTTILVWLISFFAFDQTVLVSLLIGFLGGTGVYLLLGWILNKQYLKENGITRREYKYIRNYLYTYII